MSAESDFSPTVRVYNTSFHWTIFTNIHMFYVSHFYMWKIYSKFWKEVYFHLVYCVYMSDQQQVQIMD